MDKSFLGQTPMLNIRQARRSDIDALYAISLATGFAGGDALHLYNDRRLMGHIYVAPYVVLEPELSLVAEDEEGVAGFVVGTIDTTSWEKRLELEWWPLLREQYADPDKAEMAEWTPDQRRIFMIHHPAPTPAVVVQSYPAHLHMNLLPRFQGRGMGARMFGSWLTIAIGHGAEATHVSVNKSNARALRFWRNLGFIDLMVSGAAEGRTRWMGRLAT